MKDPIEELPNRPLLRLTEIAAVVAEQKGITPRGAYNLLSRRIERGFYVAVRHTGTLMLPRSEALRILTGEEVE